MGLACLVAAIMLQGVSGTDLRARAFFDANNVKVGEQLELTIDFIGAAEFKDLHPPALAKAVGRKDWKVYDDSAKTDTFRDARRLTYRVRPMREGVLWFPALEFEYADSSGAKRTVRANGIPVHAKAAEQFAMPDETDGTAQASALVTSVSVPISEDLRFAWRKALSKATADAFVSFDFPEARLNEATCAIREGNWARALKVYRSLEWRIGQTPEIERGIVAALALRHDNPSVELPFWRQFLRPLLRFDWRGRVGLVLGGFAAIAVLFWLLGRGIRAVACLGLALFFASSACGETIETVTTNADGSVVHQRIVRGGNGSSSFTFTTSSSSGGGTMRMPSFGGSGRDPFDLFDDDFPFGARRRRRSQPVRIEVGLVSDKAEVTVGESFNLMLSVEHPRGIALADPLGLSIVEQDAVRQTAPGYSLKAAASRNPTNVISRFAFPMRALAPVGGALHYSVSGNYTPTSGRGGFGFGFFRETHPYKVGPRACAFVAREPPADGRPADYGGIVSEGLSLAERPDMLKVGTNDVVTIAYRISARGFVPKGFLPKDVAFEWARSEDGASIEYRRFFVADGASATPTLSVSYYDPRTKRYETVRAGGTPLEYE